jgi:hypothetical protein
LSAITGTDGKPRSTLALLAGYTAWTNSRPYTLEASIDVSRRSVKSRPSQDLSRRRSWSSVGTGGGLLEGDTAGKPDRVMPDIAR